MRTVASGFDSRVSDGTASRALRMSNEIRNIGLALVILCRNQRAQSNACSFS